MQRALSSLTAVRLRKDCHARVMAQEMMVLGTFSPFVGLTQTSSLGSVLGRYWGQYWGRCLAGAWPVLGRCLAGAWASARLENFNDPQLHNAIVFKAPFDVDVLGIHALKLRCLVEPMRSIEADLIAVGLYPGLNPVHLLRAATLPGIANGD